MAKALTQTHASAAAEGAEEAAGVLESPQGTLIWLCTPQSPAEELPRVFKLIRERFERAFREIPMDDARRFLTRVVGEVNGALFAAGQQMQDEGLRASIVCLFISGDRAAYTHVGDARLYLLRDGLFQQVTQDHTKAQQMVDQALLKPQEAKNHPFARTLLRTIGAKPVIEVASQGPLPVKRGDHYVLCSGGLVRRVDNTAMGSRIAEGDLLAACDMLCIEAANVDDETGGGEKADGDLIAMAAVRFGDPAPRKVVAYNPLDNIARSLMSAEGEIPGQRPRDRGFIARIAIATVLAIYLLFHLVAAPDWSGSPAKTPPAAGETGEP
ncbi:hypothetical protein K8I61_02195 [bacterium]|nr:hypothetical protein [bacterium]